MVGPRSRLISRVLEKNVINSWIYVSPREESVEQIE